MIENISFLKNLPSNLLTEIKESSERIIVPQYSFLCMEGDEGLHFYIVIKGKLGVFKELSGEQKKIGELKDGDFFGETSLISDQPRNATVTTETKSELLKISKDLFDKVLENTPEIKEEVSRDIVKRLKINNKKALIAQKEQFKDFVV